MTYQAAFFLVETVVTLLTWFFGLYLLWRKGDPAIVAAYIGLTVWVSFHSRIRRPN